MAHFHGIMRSTSPWGVAQARARKAQVPCRCRNRRKVRRAVRSLSEAWSLTRACAASCRWPHAAASLTRRTAL
eukprot:3920414-Alexandrium_andersonii.AAC.1